MSIPLSAPRTSAPVLIDAPARAVRAATVDHADRPPQNWPLPPQRWMAPRRPGVSDAAPASFAASDRSPVWRLQRAWIALNRLRSTVNCETLYGPVHWLPTRR